MHMRKPQYLRLSLATGFAHFLQHRYNIWLQCELHCVWNAAHFHSLFPNTIHACKPVWISFEVRLGLEADTMCSALLKDFIIMAGFLSALLLYTSQRLCHDTAPQRQQKQHDEARIRDRDNKEIRCLASIFKSCDFVSWFCTAVHKMHFVHVWITFTSSQPNLTKH